MKDKFFKIACTVLIAITLVLSGMLAGIRVHVHQSGLGLPQTNFTIGQLGRAYATAPDYTCDGVNDQVEFASAEAAASGGIVCLLPGTYVITNYTISDVTFEGSGSTCTRITATGTITITGNGNLKGVEVYHDDAANFNDEAITVSVGSGEWMWFRHEMLKDVKVVNGVVGPSEGTVYLGTGVLITAAAGASESYIAGCTFGPITVMGFHYGVWLYSSESTAEGGWVNGNTLTSINTYFCKHHLVLEQGTGASPSVSGNNIDIQCQSGSYDPGDKTATGLTLIGSHNNDIRFYTWDWTTSATDDAIQCDAASYNNHMWGHAEGGTIDDDGTANIITDYT